MNLGGRGVGWSWGIPGVRVGVSGTGQRWFSIGIPGTGLVFYKTLSRSASLPPQQSVPGPEPNSEATVVPSGPTSPGPKRMSWRNFRGPSR
jgi:hypothetical protein